MIEHLPTCLKCDSFCNCKCEGGPYLRKQLGDEILDAEILEIDEAQAADE